MTQKSKDKSKYFFANSIITFGFLLLSFILFIIATVVIGFDNRLSNTTITLKVMTTVITNSNASIPAYYLGSYSLMIIGIIIAGIAAILFLLNLLPLKKISKVSGWFYWSGIGLILFAMILVLGGEALYAVGTVNSNSPLKLADCFVMHQFIIPFLLTAISPFVLVIYIIFTKFSIDLPW